MQLVSNAYSRQLLEIQKHNAFYYCWDIQSILKFNLLFSLYWNLELNETRLLREGRERVKKGNNQSTHVCRHMNLYVHVCLRMLTHVHAVCIHACFCEYRRMHLCVQLCLCMLLHVHVFCMHTCLYVLVYKGWVCTYLCIHTLSQASVLFQVSNPNCPYNVDQDPCVDVGLLVH